MPLELIEEGLDDLLLFLFRVHARPGEHDARELFWHNSHFVVEDVAPDLLHVIQVFDDTALDRIAHV